jgi:hypothetical protein
MIHTTTKQKAADAINANGLHTTSTGADFLTGAATGQAVDKLLTNIVPVYRFARAVIQFVPVLKNTTKQAGNLPDSEVFSRPEHYGFGRDGAHRKAARTTCFVFLTSRPPVALKKAASGFQVQQGTRTMTTVNTPTTPTPGNTSTLARQQTIENALSAALWHIRHGDIHAATGRAIRAATQLKQACTELTAKEVAA